MIQLYGYSRSVATLRVRIVLNLKGLAYEEIPVDLVQGAQHDPEFLAVNPQGAVPALAVDGAPPLTQSLAIMEYLEEGHPEPALLPVDLRGRARVRAIALIFVADNHPVLAPRVVRYLAGAFLADGTQQLAWVRHWFRQGLVQGEAQLVNDPYTGQFCHGDTLSLADICLTSHAIVARDFQVESSDLPTVTRIVRACLREEAFERALPHSAPGAHRKASL
jgi:maleylacetoacetate isomerase